MIKDFFKSGWEFAEDEKELVSKFQMINVAIVLSSVAVLYGVVVNTINNNHSLANIEFILFFMNVVLFIILRLDKKFYDFVSLCVTAQFTFLLILLIYVSEPDQMKHSWFFTYPIVILYSRNDKYAIPWFFFLISMMLIAPLQPFVEIKYSFFQVFYLSVVLIVVITIVYFYKLKMEEAKSLILSQQNMLKEQIDELTQKDKLLSVQSRQAVMGEMISMIAHQWRQPLSTVTLNISNLQVKKLLGEKIEDETLDKVLEDISNTAVYLSDTIDDFQTYFRPNREVTKIGIEELMQKAVNFSMPRLKDTKIKIKLENDSHLEIQTYVNELIQVVLNILNNAIDELISSDIKKPTIIIKIEDIEDNVKIHIIDNANGISESVIERIFEPYFSTKGKNGTGLGLYMSQMIMQKQFNSKIEVKSSKKGSTFTITVPKELS